MSQLVRQSTPWAFTREGSTERPLTPRVVESATLRLCWVAIICALGGALLSFSQVWLQPEVAQLGRNPVHALAWLVIMLSAVAIWAIHHFKLLPSRTILQLGLVFEVMVSFGMSLGETALRPAVDSPVIGAPKVAIWIALVGLLIPNKPVVKLVTALLSASTWPLAYFLNIQFAGLPPLPTNRLIAWIYIPYFAAIVTFAISRRVYEMEYAVEKARDLGSYHLVSRIGEGGMGEVWRASHRMLAREAAVKLIRSDLLSELSASQAELLHARFEREAQAIASLSCPHTVFLYDFGVSSDGCFYFVMELLGGISLATLVEKYGPQPAGRVVYILRQVCSSLEEAHRRGLIHRDIKPSNIFICQIGIESDFAKVLDFGLVKNLAPADGQHLTMDGMSAGTPAYMAPEIALGEGPIDGRGDIYALGCVAYYLLTGVQVFDEKTATAAALAHVQKPPIPPSHRTELAIPPDVEALVLDCLAKRPDERPATAAELDRRLSACRLERPWTQADAEEWWRTYHPKSTAAPQPVRPPRGADFSPPGA